MIEIKSNSHAIEIIQDLKHQGYLEESYLTEPLANNRTKVTKIFKFKSHHCDTETQSSSIESEKRQS